MKGESGSRTDSFAERRQAADCCDVAVRMKLASRSADKRQDDRGNWMLNVSLKVELEARVADWTLPSVMRVLPDTLRKVAASQTRS